MNANAAEGVEPVADEGETSLRVDCTLYTEEAILRTCYLFTGRCYVFLEREGADHLVVRLCRRAVNQNVSALAGDFSNELINQRLRISIAAETKAIRELIVERAFAGTDVERI